MAIMAKKFCPECGSENVDMVAGGVMGTYCCNDCGYTGAFPEKPLIGMKSEVSDDEMNKHLNEIKKEIKSNGKKK